MADIASIRIKTPRVRLALFRAAVWVLSWLPGDWRAGLVVDVLMPWGVRGVKVRGA